jgi:GNAT superfamily N-acetyltransferase
VTHRIEPLGDQDLEGFGCGHLELDEWLVRRARAATGQGTRTYLLIDADDTVVGYFSIAPHLVDRDEAPRKVGRGAPRQIPAILLAKLALDESVQGRGLGAALLLFALETIVEVARRAGGRIIVVDAIDEDARRFYEHHDFQPLPGNDRRLVLKLSTAAKALGLDWPLTAARGPRIGAE